MAKTPQEPKQSSLRPDLSTLAGITLAAAGIVGGLILEKGQIGDIVQGTAAMIVLGGTLGAVLVTTPLPVVMRALKRFGDVFLERRLSATAAIETIIGFATRARKNGIVSLERDAASAPDPFLRKALTLAVDGTDLQELRKIMETDIVLGEQSGEAECKVWEAAGGYAPTIGIIGAVMGLIQVMKHLEDIKEVGHGIAVAFVATVYGVGTANILFLPAANKLRSHVHDGTVIKELILEGVVGIVEGLNPTLIRMKLDAYNPHPPKAKAKQQAAAKEGSASSPPRGAKAPQPAAAGD